MVKGTDFTDVHVKTQKYTYYTTPMSIETKISPDFTPQEEDKKKRSVCTQSCLMICDSLQLS